MAHMSWGELHHWRYPRRNGGQSLVLDCLPEAGVRGRFRLLRPACTAPAIQGARPQRNALSRHFIQEPPHWEHMGAVLEKGDDLYLISPIGRWIGVLLGGAFCAWERAGRGTGILRCVHGTECALSLRHRGREAGRWPAAADTVRHRDAERGPPRQLQPEGRHRVRLQWPGEEGLLGGAQCVCLPADAGGATQPAKTPNQPPKTVEEMAKRAGEKSAEI